MTKARLRPAVPVLVVMLMGAGAVQALAHAGGLALEIDAERTGHIDLVVHGAPNLPVELTEDVDGEELLVGNVTIGPNGDAALNGAARWRCDRRARHFVARARHPEGADEIARYGVRTPSCRRRLAFSVPRRTRTGSVRVRIRDRWRIGGIRPRVCARTSGTRRRCTRVRLRRGRRSVSRRVRLDRPGTWRVELRSAEQRVTRRVRVGGRAR